jgi:hypothetical protein
MPAQNYQLRPHSVESAALRAATHNMQSSVLQMTNPPCGNAHGHTHTLKPAISPALGCAHSSQSTLQHTIAVSLACSSLPPLATTCNCNHNNSAQQQSCSKITSAEATAPVGQSATAMYPCSIVHNYAKAQTPPGCATIQTCLCNAVCQRAHTLYTIRSNTAAAHAAKK